MTESYQCDICETRYEERERAACCEAKHPQRHAAYIAWLARLVPGAIVSKIGGPYPFIKSDATIIGVCGDTVAVRLSRSMRLGGGADEVLRVNIKHITLEGDDAAALGLERA